MRKRLASCVAFAVIALTALPAHPQKNPEDAVGFNPEKLYQFDGLDSVAMFNGNLTLTLPLVRYQVSTSLSYGMGLIYNAKAIDWESWYNEGVDPPRYEMDAHPSLAANAGHGWRVTLGRLYAPGSPSLNRRSSYNRDDWTYEGPAGDEHVFLTPFDNASQVLLSTDQAALRLVRIDNQPYPTREVQFPSGEIHKFQQLNTDWRLTEMRDRFGTRVTITYEFDTANTRRAKKWFIEEYVAGEERRSQTLSFTYYSTMEYASASRGMQVSSIEVTAPGATTATYTPTYENKQLTMSGARPFTVPTLKTFTLPDPDGTGPAESQKYEFAYNTDGTLATVTYPTGGSTSYTYQHFQFADSDDVCSNSPWLAVGAYATPAVKTRTFSDGTTNRQWEYVQRRGPQVALRDFTRCGDGFYGPFYWSRTSVLSPLDATNKRTRTDYYYDIFGGLNPHEQAEVPLTDNPVGFSELSTAGMPPIDTAKGSVTIVPEETAGYPADISASDGTRFLTSQTFGGCDSTGNCTNGTLLRSVYTEIEAPAEPYHRGPKSTRTVYEDDSGCGTSANQKCETTVTRDGDNGFGLYTSETASDNFGSALTNRRTAETVYTTWTASDRLNSGRPWIREIFTEKRVTEGGTTAKTLFDFDSPTGRLTAQRTLAGGSLAATDTLVLFGYEAASASNNFEERISERHFGGHNGGLGTTTATAFNTPVSDSTPKYILRHTHTSGVRKLSEYLTPATTCTLGTEEACVTILRPLHRTIDASTGLVTGSFDVSGVGTTYSYDQAFRFDTVTLPTGVTKSYTYTNTRATETTKKSDGTVLKTAIYDFDGLGRVKRASTSLPNSKVAVVETEYDEMGRKRRVSQPVQADSHPSSSVATNWTTTAYDAFGRPTSIKPPDHVDGNTAKNRETVIAYTGGREVQRTVQVATSVTGTSDSTTTETYDGAGRLVKVEENTGNTSSTATSGTNVTTSYTYDIGGRIASVAMQKTGDTSVQRRSFVYDFRGFLTSEVHPESGTTTYSEHDPKGHAAKRTAGGRTVRFTFDKAERLTNVEEEIPGNPPTYVALKSFTFASANTATQARAGKLHTATRNNVLPSGGAVDVVETYEYDLQGRANKRTTEIKRGATTIQTFDYGMNFDEFSLTKDLTMPTCTVTGCGNALGTVTFTRSAGFLTGITNFADLAYHASGMVNTVKHLSSPNATDTYDVENGLPRPKTIKFGGGVVCPDLPASPITAADATCPGSAGNAASVTPRAGVTHQWSISAGSTITSATTGDSITYTAAQSGTITLTVTARDACNSVVSTKTIALVSAPTPPAISAPASVCGNSAGHTASVPTTGATHTWSIAGGTITSLTTGDSITFTAGASGTVTLTATASRCGSDAQSTRDVAITSLPTAAVTGATIVRGDPVSIRVDLTGTPPWTVQWRDMASPMTVSSTPSWRTITPSPNTTTTYWVDTVTSAGCLATVNASGTVHVLPPPPAFVVATTRENLTVDLSWSAVAGASGYQLERTTLRDGVANWSTIVSPASTVYVDTLPASTLPVTYIYYVRTIDGEISNRGAFDFATGATTMYEQPVIAAGATVVKAGDLLELRRGIDAFRGAFGLGPAFGSTSPPSGVIRASDFTILVTALNEARTAAGYSNFGYSVVPQVGGSVLRLHVTEVREALR